MKAMTTKNDTALKSITVGMTFVDRSAKRAGYGRRFVTALSSATKSSQTVKCISWYEFDGAPKMSSISAARLLAGRDYSMLLSA